MPSWTQIGGAMVGAPAVLSHGNRLDVIFQGDDMKIYHKYRLDDVWFPSETEAESISDEVAEGVSAVSWGRGRIDVLARDHDSGVVWHFAYEDGTWSSAQSLGGNAVAQPVAVTWGSERLDVFVEFDDRQIWHKWWDGSDWQSWESIGGTILNLPSAVSWGPYRLDLSVRGPDNAVHHKSWDGSAWLPSKSTYGFLGGQIPSSPVEVSWGQGRLDVFCHGLGGTNIYHKAFEGKWRPNESGAWDDIGGESVPGTLHAVAPDRFLLDVVFLGPDGAVRHKAWNKSTWVPAGNEWTDLGGSIDGTPVLSPKGSKKLEVFARGADGNLMHCS